MRHASLTFDSGFATVKQKAFSSLGVFANQRAHGVRRP